MSCFVTASLSSSSILRGDPFLQQNYDDESKWCLWSILTQAVIGGTNGKVLVVVNASSGQARWSNIQKALPKLHHSILNHRPGPQGWRKAGISVSWAIGNHATPGLLKRLQMPCSRIGMTREAMQTSWQVYTQFPILDSVFYTLFSTETLSILN